MTVAFDDHVGPWTVEDVEALPDRGDHARYELLSPGVLTVSPAPGMTHQHVSRRLANALEIAARAGGAELVVFEAINVAVGDGRLTVADIAVVSRDVAMTAPVRVRGSDVTLVVEIVSPSSEATDRYIKPRLYGAAGVGAYWRFELEPIPRIVSHELRAGRFVETSVALPGIVATFTKPFPIEVDPENMLEW